MNLKTMFVLPTGTTVNGIAPELPYQFSATEALGIVSEKQWHIVDIVMPIGGSQSALFRYPQKDEKVLVGIEPADNKFYLLGYMPENPSDNIHTGPKNDKQEDTHKDILPEEMAGQFFRFKGPNDPEEKTEYSEIGFYNEQTLWKKKNQTNNPQIDTLKITSTGDINQKAANHNQIKAKRFELLVNCEGSKETDKESERGFAFGDVYGDDSALYAGDAHIRAKGKIVIKAETEIILAVGRSAIVISDSGIKLNSKKSRSTVTTAWDSEVTIDSALGVSMRGQKAFLCGAMGFWISDFYGGAIASNLGIMRLDGLDVRISTIGLKNYALRGLGHAADMAFNSSAMAFGLASGSFNYRHDASKDEFFHKLAGVGQTLGVGGIEATTFLRLAYSTAVMPGIMYSSQLGVHDVADIIGTMLNVRYVVDGVIAITRIGLENFAFPARLLRERSEVRDGLIMAFTVVEHGLALTTWGVICKALSKLTMLHESTIHLSGNSEIVMDAKKVKMYSFEQVEGESALAGTQKKNLVGQAKDFKEKVKDKVKEFKEMKAREVILTMLKDGWKAKTNYLVAGGAVTYATMLGLGSFVPFFTGNLKGNQAFYDELGSL